MKYYTAVTYSNNIHGKATIHNNSFTTNWNVTGWHVTKRVPSKIKVLEGFKPTYVFNSTLVLSVTSYCSRNLNLSLRYRSRFTISRNVLDLHWTDPGLP